MSKYKNKLKFSVALAAGVCVLAPASITHAQESPLMLPGDAVVTGFSGAAPPEPAATIPRIDLEGASAKIIPLATLPGAPSGQMSVAAAKRRITAAEVGQVFAITLDDAGGGNAPNVYLGATSMFGLHIVEGTGNDAGGAARPAPRHR